MRQRAYAEILSSQEVWRTRKRRKSCSTRSRKHFLPLECSPNFPSAQYLDTRTAESWTNCFITLSKLSMQQLPYIFIIIACTQSSTRQCLREYVFLPHSYVFVLKLRESLIKSLKITVKKILKSILRCRKVIDSPKKFFLKETTLQRMICTRHSPYSSHRWQQQQQHSPLFPIIDYQIQKFSLKFSL